MDWTEINRELEKIEDDLDYVIDQYYSSNSREIMDSIIDLIKRIMEDKK